MSDEFASVEEILEQENAIDDYVELPDKHTPEWQSYVLSLLNEDELQDGYPRTFGLRRVAVQLLGEPVQAASKFIQAPLKENDYRAIVEFTFVFKIGGMLRSYSEIADASPENINDRRFTAFLVATASTRAQGRALRLALNLDKYVAEEMKFFEKEIEKRENSYISSTQINYINTYCSENDINIQTFINSGSQEYKYIDDLTNDTALKIIKVLNEHNNGTYTIKQDCFGYDENWRSYFKRGN